MTDKEMDIREMKSFFTECMKDLFALTGIEQVRWMQADLLNGKRDFELCVDSMVQVSLKFDYISLADQKQIIRRMMVEDKQYKGLNSRTIWGWLDLHKDVHYRGQTHFQETESANAVYPSEAEVAEYVRQWQEGMKNVGRKIEPITSKEIKDESVRELKEKFGTEHSPIDQSKSIEIQIHNLWIKENYDIYGKKKETWLDEDTWVEANVDLIKESF